MKKTFYISESRLYAPSDYSVLFSEKRFAAFSLVYKELDEIDITSGAICAFDAYKHTGIKPFLTKFPIGKCKPFCFIVPTSVGNRLAFAGLKFSDVPAKEWKLALFEQTDVLKLIQDEESVVSIIDSGIIAFGDFIKMREYDEVVRSGGENHPLDRIIRFDGCTSLNFDIDEKPELAIFSSGWGDGSYSCYIGTDENSKIVCLICDFAMIEGQKQPDNGKTVPFVFDIEYEQLYQNDPRLSIDENNAAKWTTVLDNAGTDEYAVLYKAYSRRGNAYHNLGRYEAALSDYYSALEILENNQKSSLRAHEWTLYDNAGTINMMLGNNAEAIRLFEKARKAGDSLYSGAYLNLIDIYSSEKNYTKALELAMEMVSERPRDPIAYLKSAELNIATENYEHAIKYYDVLINDFQWHDAILEKTSCLSQMRRYDEALVCLENYVLENKANEFYFYNKGFLEYKRGNYLIAYEQLLNALEINPEFTPTLSLLIEIDDILLNWNSLKNWAESFIAQRPESEYGYGIRADANLRLGNYLEALADYEYIINNISTDVKYFHDYIVAASFAGNISKAKKAASRLKKASMSAYLNALGIIAFAQKKYFKAEKLFESAICEVFFDKFAADLVWFYIRLGKNEQALKQIKHYEQHSPNVSELYLFKFALTPKDSLEFNELFNQYINKYLPKITDKTMIEELKNRFLLINKDSNCLKIDN